MQEINVIDAAGGYGPPGGGFPPGGGGYGGPPGAPPPGGYGPPPGGAPPGGFGPPPGGAPPGGFGGPPQGFGPPGGGFPPPGGPMMPGAGGDVNTTLPLILSIVQLVLCCNLIFGGVSLAFAIQANNAKKAGDMEGARGKAKVAFIVFGIGLGLQLLGSVAYGIIAAMNS